VVAIAGLVQRTFLVDDADRRSCVGDDDFPDVGEAILDLRMELDCALACGFGRGIFRGNEI